MTELIKVGRPACVMSLEVPIRRMVVSYSALCASVAKANAEIAKAALLREIFTCLSCNHWVGVDLLVSVDVSWLPMASIAQLHAPSLEK
jgi:hypothetical protein